MDEFDFEEPKEKRRSSTGTIILNILTILVLLSVACVACSFVSVFLFPYIPLNPFPPPTLPAAVGFPTITPTPRRCSAYLDASAYRASDRNAHPRPTAHLAAHTDFLHSGNPHGGSRHPWG